jgi:hypothetical protein
VARSDKVSLVQFCVQDCDDLVTPKAADVCTASTVLLTDLILIYFTGWRLFPFLLLRYRLCFVQFCVQDHNDLITSGGDLGGLINVELGSPSQSTSNRNLKRSRKSYSVLRTGL